MHERDDFAHPFYFLRHGETHWNREGRTQGQLDAALSPRGIVQARAAARALAAEPIRRIVASPLSRALDTARIVGEILGLAVETDAGLMECHLGAHQGEPHGPWLAAFFRGEYAPPGGERFEDFCARAWGAMRRAVAGGPETLIVAHGGLWIAAQRFVAIEPALPRLPNALPVRVEPQGAVWRQRVLGAAQPDPVPARF